MLFVLVLKTCKQRTSQRRTVKISFFFFIEPLYTCDICSVLFSHDDKVTIERYEIENFLKNTLLYKNQVRFIVTLT